MRTLSHTGLALGAALLLTGPTLAQARIQPAQPVPVQPGGLIAVNPANPQFVLLGQKAVQEDLELTEEQLKKVNDLRQMQQAALKGLNPREQLAKMREVNEATKKGIDEMLMLAQTTRLKQLQVQQRGVNAFFDPQVGKDLGLTPDQQQKIRQSIVEANKKRTEIARDNRGNLEAIKQKLTDLNKTTMEGIVKGLTDDQRAKWRDLTGEPFKGELPGAFPGGIQPRPLPLERPNNLPPGVLPVPPPRTPPIPDIQEL